LDWLIVEQFTDLATQVEIAWTGWKLELRDYPDTPFSHALGYAIQEADIQYESWKNGFINDNT